jgi:hypothetical protein
MLFYTWLSLSGLETRLLFRKIGHEKFLKRRTETEKKHFYIFVKTNIIKKAYLLPILCAHNRCFLF